MLRDEPPTLARTDMEEGGDELLRVLRLHNFSFPDAITCWGTTRLYRCSKIDSAHRSRSSDPRPSSSSSPEKKPPPPLPPRRIHFPKLASAGAGDRCGTPPAADEEVASSPAAAAARPRNIRSRRAACNAPPAEDGRLRDPVWPSSPSPSTSPLQIEKGNAVPRSVRLRSDGDSGDKAERRKFSVQLLPEEIEEDFLAFKGKKPLRRPKKRPRVVQRKIDLLFPGFYLSEVTLDSYKVDE